MKSFVVGRYYERVLIGYICLLLFIFCSDYLSNFTNNTLLYINIIFEKLNQMLTECV